MVLPVSNFNSNPKTTGNWHSSRNVKKHYRLSSKDCKKLNKFLEVCEYPDVTHKKRLKFASETVFISWLVRLIMNVPVGARNFLFWAFDPDFKG